MSSGAKWFWRVVLLVVAAALFVFVWPTRYSFDYTNVEGRRLPVRIDRLTGKPEVLTDQGWLVPTKAQLAGKSHEPAEREMEFTYGITGRAGIEERYGGKAEWTASLYNGTDWRLTEITVELTWKGLKREYRVPCRIGPKASGTCSAEVDTDAVIKWLESNRKSPEWIIPSAKGYPPPGYKSNAEIVAEVDAMGARAKALAKERVRRARTVRVATMAGIPIGFVVVTVAAVLLYRRRRRKKLADPSEDTST